MASENEPAKLLLPYLQRADELQKHDPLVAYYCRFYAMELGLKIPQSDRTKTTNALLVSLIKQLEKDKKSLKLGPDDHLHVEGFALNVFTKADKQDRAGRADLNTAKTFYAASIFFEILNQFGELQPDLDQKQKYAAWKAADIRKAVKEGRKPVPGPPGGDDDPSLPSTTSGSEYDLEPSKSDFATGPDPIRPDPPAINSPCSDSSPSQPYNQDNFQHPTNIPPQHSTVTPSISPTISQMPVYPTGDYPPDNFHQPPSSNIPENSIYHHQSYQHQTEPEQHFSQDYPSQDIPSYSYPNLQSYPSFTEISLPTVPTHQPSYHQVSSPSITTSYPATAHYSSSAGNGNVREASPHSTDKYGYDINYQPPPEKIAEAHKAARFAVGALAFDDVSSAIDYLKKSLELLTNPAARH